MAYEFEPRVASPVPKEMLGKDNWPAGGVSDDTLLSLMTLSTLSVSSPTAAARLFIEKLRANKDSLRGLGPTTRTILGMHVEEREHDRIGYSNGGIMRTALVGVALAKRSFEVRNAWVRELCAVTHDKADALSTAQVMAEIFAQVTQFPDVQFEDILENVKQQFETMTSGFAERIESWTKTEPSSAGVTLNPVETFSAVISVIRHSLTVWDSYERAICLGGDTDTVAALSGAFTALKNPDSFYELDFVADVDWDEIPNWKDFVSVISGGGAN